MIPGTTLEAAAAFLPTRSVAVEELAGPLGLKRAQVKVLRRVYGVDRMRIDPALSLFDLLLPAAQEALKAVDDLTSVRYLLYAHATQEVTPSTMDAAEALRASLGLTGAEAFAITQHNCASGLLAVDIAATLLATEERPDARALVITGEKPFSPLNQSYMQFGLVMGEAASALLIGRNGTGDEIRSYATKVHGELHAGIFLTHEQKEYNSSIGGRVTVEVAQQALREAGLTIDDIAMVIPHNPDMSDVRDMLGVGPERFFTANLARYSHCYASDVFVNWVTLRDAGQLTPGGHYLLIATGLGATFGALVVTARGGR